MGAKVQIVVGLGNPGARYDQTRHNAGFWWVDGLARQLGAAFRAVGRFHGEVAEARGRDGVVRLLKPTTFMNNSGRAVRALSEFYRVPASSVLVAHDEIDLPVGTVRLKQGGGDGGHRGLRDIIPAIGGGFHRLRIGVGRPEHSEDVVNYVLKRAPSDEQRAIESCIERSLALADDILAGDAAKAMNELNRRARKPTDAAERAEQPERAR